MRWVVACVLCLCAWLPVASATTVMTAWGDDGQCSNAVRLQHPVCHHGGYLFANHTTDTVNCADCVCPDGWAGTDCSMCTGVDACPPQRSPEGGVRDARACTWRSLIPNTLERTSGKRYSCTCGMPGDVWSEYYCRLQPHTNFLLNLVTTATDAASQSTTLQVDAYGGMPSQDMTVSDHYDFAVPGWWDSEFSDCEWTRDVCDKCPKDAFCPWSDEEQCYFLECKSGDVSCPPSYATPCPGYTRSTCGTSPEDGRRYWQHHCSVLATPKSGLGFRLMCQTSDTAAAPGVFNCSFSQPGSTTLIGLGMQCRTGACEYEEAPPPVDPGKGHEARGFPAATKVVLACTAAALLLCVVAVAAFMRTHVVHIVPHAESLLDEQHDAVDGAQPSSMIALLGERPHAAALPLAAAATSPRPQLSWHFVRCDVQQWDGHTKTLLLDVCGVAGGASGTGLFALMGPSGSGKSTLLDVLSGRSVRGHVTGSIRLDGVVTTKATRRSICGYVLQDEVLPGTQTVWEYLLFHASLRLPSSTTPVNRVRRVRDTVAAMQLQRVAASVIGDVFVRGLSGGERRRLAIGAELLAAPRLLLLDEPTTGLDSASAGAIVDLLAALGVGGGGGISSGPSTVLVSLHQPSLRIFRTFERATVLHNGRAVFSGPTDGLRAHFSTIGLGYVSLGAVLTPTAESSSSPADPAAANLTLVERLLDTLTASEETETEAAAVTGAGREQQSTDGGGREEPTCDVTGAEMGQVWTGARSTLPPAKYMCGFGQQLYVLSGRQLANLVRHPLLFALVYGSSLGAAVVLGLVFYDTGFDTAGIQNRLGSLFFMVIFLSLLSLSILPVWREEQLLFVCERANGCYGTGAYFSAVVLFDLLPLRVVPPCMFAFVSYWMIGLRAGSIASLLWFMLILVLSNLTSTTLCMAVGVFTSSDATANVVSTFLLVASMLYGGFLLSLSHMPPSMQLLSELSFVKHAFEALAVNEFSDPRAVYVFTAAIPSDELPPLRCSGDYVLQEFGFRRARFHANVAALVGMCVVTLTLTYVGLAASDTGVWYRLQQRVAMLPSLRRRKRLSSHATSSLPGTGDDINGRGTTPTAAVLEPLLPAATRSGDLDLESRVSIPEEQIPMTTVSTVAPDVEVVAPSFAACTAQHTTVLAWHNVTYTVRDWRGKTKSILRDVSGLAGSGITTGAEREEGVTGGAMCAVLGPSGAGKSSLLDILSGRVSLSDRRGGVVSGGVITAAGRQITGAQLQAVVGYVPQEVVLPATSTVTEYLTFHGELRLPCKAQRYRGAAVRRVVDLLGLRKVRHSMVGDAWVRGLSGGERRRLSVGAELIHTPAVLIMDEPTTGLDGSNARKLLGLLAELSRTYTTIVLSLHQPSASMLRVFHRAVVLSGTGALVYSGPYSTLAHHFAALELQGLARDALGTVDGVLEALGGAQATTGLARELEARFPTSPAGVAEALLLRRERERAGIGPDAEGGQRPRRRRPGRVRAANSAGFVRQLAALRTRHTYKLLRDPSMVWLSYGAHAAMATGVGLAYRNAGFDTWGIQNRMGALFFVLVYLALLSLSSLPLWREERALFLRERASGVYGTSAYFVTVVLFDLLPLRILPPCLLTVIAYPLVGFQHESWRGPACFTAVVILSNLVSTTLSMAVGALAPNNAVANVVGSLAALLSILTGGFLLSKAHLSPVTAVVTRGSYVNYAFEALLVNEFAGQRGFAFTSYTKPPVAVNVTGDQVLETFGFHPKAMLSDAGWLVAMALGFLTLTYVLLHLKRR